MTKISYSKTKKDLSDEKNFYPALTTFSTAFTFALIAAPDHSNTIDSFWLTCSIYTNSIALVVFLFTTIITRIPNPNLKQTLFGVECYKYIHYIVFAGYISIVGAVQGIIFYLSPVAGYVTTSIAVFLATIIIKLYSHIITSKFKFIFEKI